MTPTPRLAAIMVADVVGYSRLMRRARWRLYRAFGPGPPSFQIGVTDTLDGHGSPTGSCVWRALRQGWGGKCVRQESDQDILVAALGMLARHYGIR